jgi:FKBP-type peptidyl-prolyl cis-trans isomerase FklB
MRTTFFTAVISMATAATLFADDGTNILGDDKSKISYAVGMMFGHTLQQQSIDVNSDMLLRGIKDMQSGGTTLMTPQEAQVVIRDFQKKMHTELTVKNKAEGDAFMATNKDNPGVVTLPDGLQYKVITDGTGETPLPTDMVTANYRGTFLNGTEFGNSYKSGQPAQFQVNRVIPGWTEAITHMKVGSKWQLFVPPELAYGENGAEGRFQPNMTLIYEIELLAVQHPQAQHVPTVAPQPLTSDIIKVQGTNVEVLKPEDVQKLKQSQTQPVK